MISVTRFRDTRGGCAALGPMRRGLRPRHPNARGPSAPPPQCAIPHHHLPNAQNFLRQAQAGPVRGSQRRTAQCASVPPDEGPSVQSLDRTVRQAPVFQALVRNLLPPPPRCAKCSPPAAAQYARACGRCGPACHVPGGLPPVTQYARDPRPMCRGWMPDVQCAISANGSGPMRGSV